MSAALEKKLKGRVAVLAGGRSAEREISLKSGDEVFKALQQAELDVVFIDPQDSNWLEQLSQQNIQHTLIALHGGDGEDGTIQGTLEMLGISYTGSGVLGSALAMDKMRSKQLWQGIGVATADYACLDEQSDLEKIIQQLNGKCIVKPAQEGSSIGMKIATDAQSLKEAFDEAKKYGTEVIAERWIQGPEYTIAILGSEVLPIIEMQTDNNFYDYEAKYIANDTRYLCPCDLTAEQNAAMQKLALDAFNSLNCKGWGRVDVMIDSATNKAYVLEVNTSPGMTDHSLVPMAAKAHGLSFNQLVLTILELSLEQ